HAGQGVAERGIGAGAPPECSVAERTTGVPIPDDGDRVVDAVCIRVQGVQRGRIEVGTDDAEVDESVDPAADVVSVSPDDLARIVDAIYNGAPGSSGPVERDEGGHLCCSAKLVVSIDNRAAAADFNVDPRYLPVEPQGERREHVDRHDLSPVLRR